MHFQSIDFSNCNAVTDLMGLEWAPQTTKFVEFFPFYFSKVTFVQSDSPDLLKFLYQIDDGYPVFFDLEWKPDRDGSHNDISVMQFATSKGVVILQLVPGVNNPNILAFINHHKFIGKGTHFDRYKLFRKYGQSLHLELEDVEVTRLKPRGLSLNFDEMVLQHAGNPTIPFKDKSITLSDWSAPILSTPQILYAAFDVVALQHVAAKLPIYKKEQRRKAKMAPEIKVTVAPRHCSDSGNPLKISYQSPK